MAKERQTGAKPTHKLRIKDKTTGFAADVGVGWMNLDTGAVSLKLNAHIVLSELTLRDNLLTLFPSDYEVSTSRTMQPDDGTST